MAAGSNLEWFKKLSPKEQAKQIRRWRYVRQYQRKRLGDQWELIYCLMHS